MSKTMVIYEVVSYTDRMTNPVSYGLYSTRLVAEKYLDLIISADPNTKAKIEAKIVFTD